MKLSRTTGTQIFLFLLLVSLTGSTIAQTQVVRGQITDVDAAIPLPGASVVILNTNPLLGTTSDLDGYFRLEGVPVGRHDIAVSFIGYEPVQLSQVIVSSGKELVLNLELTESITELNTVVIEAEESNGEPLNEMATVSARSFSVEETGRYAAAFNDPARMAQNFAGVTGGGDDLSNEIIIRGNSSRGSLWRLEGIEIPNPNHFAALGNGGGAISMLSSTTLSTSDFYTGAFPSEFGNATSGVFDLNFRNGNNEQREHSVMVGLLGVELGSEGYFKKGSRASYLVNYRYSTLALLSTFLQPVGDILPAYQDLSFKVNVPTKQAGTFTLFGLGGASVATEEAEADSTAWEDLGDREGFEEYRQMGVMGLSHKYLLSDRTWMKTIVSGSYDHYRDRYFELLPQQNYFESVYDSTLFTNYAYRVSSTLTHKASAKSTIRAGLIYSHQGYTFDYQSIEDSIWVSWLDGSGSSGYAQGFAQWKYRFADRWALNVGAHGSFLTFNQKYTIEPRAAVEYRPKPGEKIALAAGIHTRPEHLSTYFLEENNAGNEAINEVASSNRDLDIMHSAQFVGSYSRSLGSDLNIKAELYYQHLYKVAIEQDPNSTASILNASSVWDLISGDSLVSNGRGRNYGIDLSAEKSFSRNYYMLFSGSIFKSQYRPANGKWYSTIYDRNYTMTVLGGKEFPIGKNRQNVFALNGKAVLTGGQRQFPIDLAASREAGRTVRDESKPFADQLSPYYRFDMGMSFRFNRDKTTHSFVFEIQNVSNRLNTLNEYYNASADAIESNTLTGIFPNFNYRVEF